MSLFPVTLLVLAMVGLATPHEWGWGRCPKVNPFPNLAVDKYLGLWYVIEQFDTSSSCLTLNYTRVSPTELRVTKERRLFLLDSAGVNHTNSYTASLDMPDELNPARMRVKWPLNMAGKGDYVVFDTDYTNYAGIYECQQVTSLGHRQSAAILSRESSLAPEFVERVKRRLHASGVNDFEDFDKIDHSQCGQKSDQDFKLNIDENTFRNIVSETANGIRNVASTVVGGIKTAAGVVAEGTRRWTQTEPTELPLLD